MENQARAVAESRARAVDPQAHQMTGGVHQVLLLHGVHPPRPQVRAVRAAAVRARVERAVGPQAHQETGVHHLRALTGGDHRPRVRVERVDPDSKFITYSYILAIIRIVSLNLNHLVTSFCV